MLKKYIRNSPFFPFLFYKITSLYRKYPLVSSNNNNQKMIFVVGSGRSGTTLFRSLLWSGKIATLPPETYGLKKCILTFALYNYLPWSKLSKKCIDIIRYHGDVEKTWGIDFDKIYEKSINFSKDKRNAYNLIEVIYQEYQIQKGYHLPFIGDKTPNNTMGIFWIYPVFKNAYFIHLVRNGLDVAKSYSKSNIKAHKTEESAIIRWKDAVNQVRELFKNNINKITIKYEDLVDDPKAEMKSIYNFLSLEYNNSWKKHNEYYKEMGDTTLYTHHQNVSKTIEEVKKSAKAQTEIDINLKNKVNNELKYYNYT